MSRLSASYLGALDLRLEDQQITTLEYDKVRALLVYLMVESEQPHRREYLVGLLWPDYAERAARQNLSQALLVLRRAIGDHDADPPFLHITTQTLQFNTSSNYSLDVSHFTGLIRSTQQHAHADLSSCNDCLVALEQAVSLYGGPFLSGFSLADCPEFAIWLTLQRERYQQQVMDAYYQLTQAYLLSGDYARALVYARHQLTLDNWHEPAYRQAMAALAIQGQRSAALTQYEACVQHLHSELGVTPEPATTELYDCIKTVGSSDESDIRAALHIGTLTPAPGASPYLGLDFFDVRDADLFVGRETLTESLVKALQNNSHFLAVVGASGSGKSSLVRAGLAAKLQHDMQWEIAVLTPGSDPLGSLEKALAISAGESSVPHLLVVDQFEELFTLCRDSGVRQVFVDQLLSIAADGDARTYVVIALRADFYHHCAQFEALRELLEQHQVYIGSMSNEELRRVIEVPAMQNGWLLDAGLAEVILRDLGIHAAHSPEPGALPLLSHALLETWRRRQGRKLVLSGYTDAGGVQGAIAQTAEEIYQDVDADTRAVVRDIFVRLTELGEGTQDTRRCVLLSEFTSLHAESGKVQILIKRLTDARLITADARMVQVTHEALIREWPTLRVWLEENRESLRLHRHLTEASQAWDAMGRDPGELYRGPRLAQVVEWEEGYSGMLNTLEKAFLDASKAMATQQEAERVAQRQRELKAAQALADAERKRAEERGRMLRWIGVVAILLLVAAVVAGVLGIRARLVAEENAALAHENEIVAASAEKARQLEQKQREAAELAQEEEARQRKLAEQAEYEALVQASVGLASRALDELTGVSPERAVLLSLAALNEFPYTPQAESALARAVLENRPYMTLVDSGGARYHNKVAWSPDGRYIAAGQFLQEDIAVIWDSQTGQIVKRLPWDETRAGQCQKAYIAWSPSSKYLFVSTNHQSIAECNTIQVWDVVSGEQRFSRPLGSYLFDMTQGVDWSPDEQFVASFAADNFARIWEVSTAQAENPIERETSQITLTEILSFTISTVPYDHSLGSNGDIRWSPDGQRIAIASAWEKSARIWNAESGDEVLTLTGHTSEVTDVSWSPDGKQLATASLDGNIRVWDGESGQVISIFAGHTGGTDRAGVQAVAWSPDGSRVASAGGDRTVRVWQAGTGEELLRYYGITNPWDVAWSPKGERLVVRGAEEIRIVDLTTGLMRLPNSDTIKEVVDAQYSYDGNRLATDTGGGAFIPVWDTTGAEMVKLDAHIMQGHLAWSPVNYDLAAGGNPLRIWDTNTGEIRLEITTIEQAWYHTTAWSPDSSKILGSSCYIDTWPVYVFDAQTGENLLSFGDYAGFKYAEWSPDGTRIATGCLYSMDGLCPSRIWDAETGETLLELDGSYGDTHFLEWSPEGTRLATAHTGGSAIVWDVDKGIALTIFSGHDEWVADVTWSPDGNRVASGDIAGTVKGWDAATGAEVFNFQVPGGVVRLDWSPDGEHLVVAGEYDAPIIYPVWQNTEDLTEYAQECCVFRELTPEERAQFKLAVEN